MFASWACRYGCLCFSPERERFEAIVERQRRLREDARAILHNHVTMARSCNLCVAGR